MSSALTDIPTIFLATSLHSTAAQFFFLRCTSLRNPDIGAVYSNMTQRDFTDFAAEIMGEQKRRSFGQERTLAKLRQVGSPRTKKPIRWPPWMQSKPTADLARFTSPTRLPFDDRAARSQCSHQNRPRSQSLSLPPYLHQPRRSSLISSETTVAL